MGDQEVREHVVLENQGQKIFGIIHRPNIKEKYPAVLMCHGLGGHKSGKHRLYVVLARMLSSLGIASLRIDFRGSGDSEGEFQDMTLFGEVSDAVKGLEFLARDPSVDSSRLGLFGRSIGGAVAVLTANSFTHIKSLALWAPVFSGEQWQERWDMLHKEGISEDLKTQLMKVDGQVAGYNFYKELFSIQMDKTVPALHDIPLLHIHGEKDHVVQIDHANQYMSMRDSSAAETMFIRLSESDHDFSDVHEQKIALKATCNWFERTLKGAY